MWLFYNLPPPLWWQSKGALATHVPKTREAEELAEGERLCSAVGRIKRTASSSFYEKLKINELPVSALKEPAVFWKEPEVLQFSQFCRSWLLHTSKPVLRCFESHGYKPKETP
jgi:hypothetical protein